MAADGPFQLATPHLQGFPALEPPEGQKPLGQVRRHYQGFAVRLQRHVLKIGMHRDGQVGRQGPGRGGPDDQGDILKIGQFRQLSRGLCQRKLHKNRRSLVFLVLHLGLGQGGAAGGAPVDGLFAAMDGAAEIKPAVFLQDFRHIGRVHGQIRLIPVAQHPQALELGPLNVDKFFGIIAAALPHLNLGQAEPLGL